MLVIALAKEGACPLKAAFFPTAFQTACLLLFLMRKNNNKPFGYCCAFFLLTPSRDTCFFCFYVLKTKEARVP